MSGTKEGGRKAAEANKLKHGKYFYKRIGQRGGRNGHSGGFASEVVGRDGLTGFERAQKFGAIGGRKSRRGGSKELKEALARHRVEIYIDADNGRTIPEIAQKYGLSYYSVQRILAGRYDG